VYAALDDLGANLTIGSEKWIIGILNTIFHLRPVYLTASAPVNRA
jgi:hypothetical protein